MASSDLARLVKDKRDEIASRFAAAVARKEVAPAGVSQPLLVDHIPRFLDEIVAELQRAAPVRTKDDVVDTSATARAHGEQRWTLGYDLDGLIREYGVLRHCILVTAAEAGIQVSMDEVEHLSKCLGVGVAEAVSAYVEHRDQELHTQKANLELLAEAGHVLSLSLDYRSTMNRLTNLVVPRLADWCAVHLEGVSADEMPLSHVDPVKREILRDHYRRFPMPASAPNGPLHVVATGEPQLVQTRPPGFLEEIAQSAEHLAMLRILAPRSWIRVPLRVQDHVFGAMTLAYSESERHYTPDDLVLVGALAQRAALALDNARLYELSQQARSRVEAATRAKDEFVAMVSHELRTPLNAILGWLRLMRTGSLPDSKREHALEVIERNANAQDRLVADLLDISKVITGKIRINPSQVDLANVVEMAIEGIRPAADAKQMEIHADVPRDSLMRGDADRLQQIAWNLLANAVKFTPKGGRIEIRLRRVASDLELVVEDNGEGIRPSFLPHVFESFRQADTSATRPHGGLGIGLSIVKHLVELHGGSIEARSAGSGQGATFVVRLPISPLVSTTLGVARVPATTDRPEKIRGASGAAGLRVLVVDDEPDARDLVAYVLETSGMEVQLADSAADALAKLAVYTPDVIISDIGMAEEDGYSLIRSIRTLDAADKSGIPALALTAFARNEDRTRALVEGFTRHMTKPVEPALLVAAVIELAGHTRR